MEAGRSRNVDARQLRRDFEAVKEGTRRFDDPDEVLSMFNDAFSRLFGASITPTSIASAATTSNTPQRLDASDILLIETVQSTLLLRIVVDFHTALQSDRLRVLLHGWFFGATLPPPLRGTIQQCALRTVSRHLSSPNPHPLTLSQLEQLCTSFTRWSLTALIAAVQGEANQARADVTWSETLRLLTSIPDRLANATQGRLPEGFEEGWFEGVLVDGLARCLSGGEVDVKRVREVLLRLDKMGYLSRAMDSEGRGFWGTMLQQMRGEEGVAKGWTRVRAKLGRGLRGKLDAGLVETLLYWMGRRGLPTGLVTAGERGRAGTEGTAFLGKESQEAVAAVSLLFDTLLCPPSQSSTSDSDSDTDDNDDSIIDTFTNLSLTPGPPQTPLLAWSYTTHLSTHLSPSSLLNCLESTLSHWSLPHRIARTLLPTELFLTTLITVLLAVLPTTTPGLTAVARSQRVIEGVSAHLDAPDPTVRRLGMLVAELLSAKTAEGGRVLNFGRGVWNGVGEGREDVRVFRALSDAWSHHRRVVEEARERLKGRPLGEVIDVIGITTQSEVVKPQPRRRVTKRTGKGRTRRLPEKVDPPPRQAAGRRRPLITMLGSDDEQEPPQQAVNRSPLTMFSSTQNSGEQDASSASSSSSDSDSDTAPASDPHSVHRLAASLSGLSATEAGNILASHPSHPNPSPRRQTSKEKVSDFDTNRESHAPQFNTRTPPPIYISQLSPLLRSSTRASIRLALHHAAPLIRRKSSTPLFGGEVRENAVDLSLTLIALHDNFGIKRFEEMRREAVRELAIAQPKVVVEVLVEAGMGAVYSDAQRGACWWGVAESAVVLARGRDEEQEHVGRRAEKIVEGVIRNAREAGEESVPQMRRQRQLQVSSSMRAAGGVSKLVTPHNPSTSLVPSRKDVWEELAAPTYIFPLIHRYLAYRSHHLSHPTSLGAGTRSLFTPTTLSLFYDTLTVLLSLSPHHTIATVMPSVLELLATSVDPGLSPTSPVVASLMTLLAVTLDRMLQAGSEVVLEDAGCVRRLQGLLGWAKGVFAELQGAIGGTEGKVAARAASVLLLMARLDEVRTERVRRLIGFVPA